MPVYQVYDNLERVLNRVYSDDYDMKENCVPTGQDFSVKVGDVTFRANHGRFDKTGFTVFVDGIAVMRYRYAQATHARFNDEPATQFWEQDSPALRAHVKAAAVELGKRYREWQRVQERRERTEQDQQARKLRSFKERFGIE